MRSGKQNMIGVSLIEAILALVIVAAIILLGLRQYQTYSLDTAAQQLRYNAEDIMHAAAYYYYANCQNSAAVPAATLDPANSPADPFTTVTVSDLVASNYLMKAPAQNRLVNPSGANGGYLIQFKRSTSTRYYCSTPGNASTCTSPIGNNIIYTVQVSVLLSDASTATRYLKMTGATCLTTTSGSNKVEPCSGAAAFSATCQTYRNLSPSDPGYAITQFVANNMGCPPAGGTYNNYLSWERLPSMTAPKGQSVLWLSNPVVKQFKQSNELPNSLSYMLANPTVTNFLCGS